MSKQSLPILQKYCEETECIIINLFSPPPIEGFKFKTPKIIKKKQYCKVLFHDLDDYLNNKNLMHYTFPRRGKLRNWWKKAYIVDKYLSDKLEWWKKDYLNEKYDLSLKINQNYKYKLD
jgi:hypothetical protein